MAATDGIEQKPAGVEEEVVEKEEKVEGAEEHVELTIAELEAKIKSETDRRLTSALKTREAELSKQHKKELEEKTKEAYQEAEALAKLSQEERLKVEKDKEEFALKTDREKLDRDKLEFEKDKLKLTTEKILVERKLPPEFVNYLVDNDAESTLERINRFEAEWQESLKREVDERIAGPKPKFSGDKAKRYTREQVAGMSKSEVAANLADIEKAMENW